jgi:hypothetical protein
MVKVESNRIVPKDKGNQAPAVTPEDRYQAALRALEKALKNDVLSLKEVKSDLAGPINALTDPEKGAIFKLLADQVSVAGVQTGRTGRKPIRVGTDAFNALAELGMSEALLLQLEQYRDRTTRASVTQGLEKKAVNVDGGAASKTRHFITESVSKSHKGKKADPREFTPAAKLATAVSEELLAVADQKLDDKLGAGMKAAKDAVKEKAAPIIEKALAELVQNPEALRSADGIFHTLLDAAGTTAMNPEAVEACLQQVSRMGPAATAAATKAAGRLGITLGGDAAKLAPRVGAATAGKALPVVGNAIAVGSFLFAGADLLKQIFTKPRDGEKIAKSAVHTLTQGVGIAFPWVAFGGDLANIGWSAKIAHQDELKAAGGDATPTPPDLHAAFEYMDDGAHALRAMIDGALSTDGVSADLKEKLAATKNHVDALRTKTRQLQELQSHSNADLDTLRREQSDLLASFGDLTKAGLEESAKEAQAHGKPAEASALEKAATAAGKFATTLVASRIDAKNAQKGDLDQDDVDAKRKKRSTELMDATTDLITSTGALLRSKKPAADLSAGA